MHEAGPERQRYAVQHLATALSLDLSNSTANFGAANEPSFVVRGLAGLYRPCKDGERTEQLEHNAGVLVATGCTIPLATSLCLEWNEHYNDPPLDVAKVRKTVASIARTHWRNHPNDDPSAPLFDVAKATAGRFIGVPAPERDWVLVNCLPLGKTALMVAPGGTGKSQMVLQLAVAIACGDRRFSPWLPGEPGQVVVIGAEDEEEEYHRRIERIFRELITDPAWTEVLRPRLEKDLIIVSRVGENNLVTERSGSGEVVSTVFVDRLVTTLKSLMNLRLIIWDPVSRFRGGDENFAGDTTRFVEAAEKLAKLTGAAVLLVHHARKGSQGADQSQEVSRGSSALTDGVRLQINLAVPNPAELAQLNLIGPTKYLVAKITKTNYSAAGEPVYLRRDEEGRLWPVDLALEKHARQTSQIERIVELVRSERNDGREYSKNSFAQSFRGVDGRFGVGEGTLKKLVDEAIRANRLRVGSGRAKVLEPVEPIAKAKIHPPTDDGRAV